MSGYTYGPALVIRDGVACAGYPAWSGVKVTYRAVPKSSRTHGGGKWLPMTPCDVASFVGRAGCTRKDPSSLYILESVWSISSRISIC